MRIYENGHYQYVYMHFNIPVSFWIWLYSEFDTVHENSTFCLDIPNYSYSDEDMGYADIICILGAFSGHVYTVCMDPVHSEYAS